MECHVLEKDYIATDNTRTRRSADSTFEDVEQPQLLGMETKNQTDFEDEEKEDVAETTSPPAPKEPEPVAIDQPRTTPMGVSRSLWMEWACSLFIWKKKIFAQFLRNPVVMGIVVAFFFSLTTIGPRAS